MLALFVKCSTDKDAWLNKTYHNTTAHYNGYWNAKEIIKETMYGFESGDVENYDVIIQFGYTSSSIWSFLWPKHSKHIVNIDDLLGETYYHNFG